MNDHDGSSRRVGERPKRLVCIIHNNAVQKEWKDATSKSQKLQVFEVKCVVETALQCTVELYRCPEPVLQM